MARKGSSLVVLSSTGGPKSPPWPVAGSLAHAMPALAWQVATVAHWMEEPWGILNGHVGSGPASADDVPEGS